jgi:hypothetical protein
MISGYLKLRAAAQRLDGWNGDPDVLVEAAEHFWSAAYHADSWPTHVKGRYERIRYRLFTQGTIRRSIATLPETERRDLGEEMRRFTAAALSGRTSWMEFDLRNVYEGDVLRL